ncbi:MAG TPA: DinB family protein [Bacteroidia bacterium]|jgi:hypothetical protein|nr:DinB family protein [Bacteroidia bacterium]
MEQLKWTERKFNFGFRKEYLPFMLERIKSTAPRIEELMKNISEEKASKQINKQWSAKEHIGHLIDLEELHLARVGQFKEGLAELRAADMSNTKTYEANHNNRKVSELTGELRRARAYFISEIEKIDEGKLEHQALHPRLQKKITVTDLVYFVGEHDNHHLTITATLLRT